MIYSTKVIVDIPLNEFITKFDKIENMKHWQKGLVSAEHISGTPGHTGAKMKLIYKLNNSKLELMETITHRNLPHEFHSTYHNEGVHNLQENFFTETSKGYTEWVSKSEFLPLTIKMRAMMWLMPRTFKKQSLKYMNDFKNFAENGISVNA